MSEETIDSTEVIPPPAEAQPATTEQEVTPEPVNDDTATSTEDTQEVEPSRAEKRIQQLVGDKKAAMEYGNFWKDKFEQSHAPAPEVVETPAPLVMPKLEDFDHDTDKWSVAITDYNAQFINQAVSQGVSTALAATNKQAAQTAQDVNWTANVAKFKEANPDIDFNKAFATKDMYSIIKGQDNGPEIAVYLGQNPAEAQRIGMLPQSQQAFELGKLKMSPSKPAAAPITTQAPEPPNPVGGAQPNDSIHGENIDDFMKRRRAEVKAKRA